MLHDHIVLDGSRDGGAFTQLCSRCDTKRPKTDGVNLGARWVCGKCWRQKATRPQGAMAALAQEKRKSA